MKILVSGASGYIGTSLINSLLRDGIYPGAITRSGVLPYTDIDSADIYQADISKPFTLALKEQYDMFIHLAAANDIDSANPETAINGTTLGTRYCLDFCKKNNIRKFIYFSTFQVIGRTDGYIDEGSVPEPKNDYGIT